MYQSIKYFENSRLSISPNTSAGPNGSLSVMSFLLDFTKLGNPNNKPKIEARKIAIQASTGPGKNNPIATPSRMSPSPIHLPEEIT